LAFEDVGPGGCCHRFNGFFIKRNTFIPICSSILAKFFLPPTQPKTKGYEFWERARGGLKMEGDIIGGVI